VVWGSLEMISTYHEWFWGSKTLLVVYKKVSKEIRSNWSIYGKSGMCQKVKLGPPWE
jgi:hypothetical protein